MSDLTPPTDPAREPPALPPPAAAVPAGAAASPAAVVPAAADGAAPASRRVPWLTIGVLLLALLSVIAALVAWQSQQRVTALEQELVRRQQDSGARSAEARLIAKQAQEWSQEASAKVTLLEQRVAEATLQRSQLDDLVLTLSRSREENLVADIEAGLRVAMQQAAITGSAEPLMAELKAADERLARDEQPRLDLVRRAIVRDLDRVRAAGVADLASLAAKLDEAVRLVDDAPLLVIDAARGGDVGAALAKPPPGTLPKAGASAAAAPAPSAPASAAARTGWLPEGAGAWWRSVWTEASGLLRVSRIDRPEAMLLAPEQGFFLRENLKLKLLNARLALLSRQFDVAQTDLRDALDSTDRYFDRNARKTLLLGDLLRSVVSQARQVGVPRPDDTLAALAAAGATGR